MITSDHPLIDEGYNWIAHSQEVDRLAALGFVSIPNWMPTPPPDCYEAVIVGGIDAMIKPKPKLRHWLRWGIWPLWLKRIWWRARRPKNLF